MAGKGIDISCDIRRGLQLPSSSVDYAVLELDNHEPESPFVEASPR
jgi:hypothetical protein